MNGPDLAERHLQTLRKLFRRHLQEARILAYGSRVTGNHHDGSDLDLVVVHADDPEKPVPGVSELRSAIAESDIPVLVDLQEWYRLNEKFRQEIELHSIVLWPEKSV